MIYLDYAATAPVLPEVARAMNEAYAATDTIQSVNISCDIPAIGLKEGRTEKQVYQIIDNYSKCTTTGVVVR